MLTRCPHCRTSFRVRPEQLRMRGGRVRCGHCSKPFNALEALLEEDGLTPALADAVESPQDTSNAGTDDDGAPLFLLEDADPNAQRAADGDGDDDEIPELFIEGWSWRRSHTPELSPGRAERSPDTERLGIPSGDVGDGDDGAAGPESPRPTETDTAGRSIEGTGETDGSPDGISKRPTRVPKPTRIRIRIRTSASNSSIRPRKSTPMPWARPSPTTVPMSRPPPPQICQHGAALRPAMQMRPKPTRTAWRR